MKAQETSHIALFIAPEIERSRDFLFGAHRYASDRQHLQIHRVDRCRKDGEAIACIQQGKYDAVIRPLFPGPLADWLTQENIPAVSYYYSGDWGNFTTVNVDDIQVGALAATHFLHLKLPHFAYAGTAQNEYSLHRQKGYVRTLTQAGHAVETCEIYEDREAYYNWLKHLPRPCGLYVAWDRDAAYTLRLLAELNLSVPDQISVLGTDNDRLECYSANPPLSSIELPSEKLGFEAVRKADQLLQNQAKGRQSLLLPPRRVVTRKSTQPTFHQIPELKRALTFISENTLDRHGVPDLCDSIGVHRRTLEKLFRKHIGHSIHTEMQNHRIFRAKELLINLDVPVKAVASLSGFNSHSRFCKVFKQYTGQLPTQYRKLFAIESPE